MRKETIEGIGTIHGGEYENIRIDGVGKSVGTVITQAIYVDGLFKSKGRLETNTLKINGFHRAFYNVRAKEVKIDGLLKLRRASLLSDSISCFGVLVCTHEVNADQINIEGICSISKLYGDTINIKYHPDGNKRINIPRNLRFWMRSYFGREVSLDKSIVDFVEGTKVTATKTTFKTIRAQSVSLKDHCRVEKIYCDGEIELDKTCVVGQIISNGEVKKCKGNIDMDSSLPVNSTLIGILDLYKNNKISAQEAEKMLTALDIKNDNDQEIKDELSWPDDGKLRVVAFIGQKLLKKNAPESTSIEVFYEGDALDVDSYGSIRCGRIQGNAKAGSTITCEDIGGNATAGSSIRCKNINGNATAGSSVHIEK